MTSTWHRDCTTLWGDDWIAPLSEVLQINRRTVERWRGGNGEPRAEIIAELRRLAELPNPRAVGRIVRRLSRGESMADIKADIEADRDASRVVAKAIGSFETIAALSPSPK